MPTVNAGSIASIHCPLDSTITVTPGATAKVSVQSVSSPSFLAATITDAKTLPVTAGDLVIITAIDADVTYTDPALSAAQVAATVGAGGSLAFEVHPNLWCDISAQNLCADDGAALDRSGAQRHATRGAQISIAEMNATAGYFASKRAGTPGDNTILHLPSINFDYDGGERLLVVLLFKAAAPGVEETIIGNSAANTLNGWRFRLRTTGYIDSAMYSVTGAVASFSGNCINVMADGTLHQLAILMDGNAKTRSFWEDGSLTRDGVASLATCDTRESSGLHLGGYQSAPTTTAGTSAISFRRVTIMRWAAGDSFPGNAAITPFVRRLRDNQHQTPAAGDLK